MTHDKTTETESESLINRDRIFTIVWAAIAGLFLTAAAVISLAVAGFFRMDALILLTPVFMGATAIAFTWFYNHYRLPELEPIANARRTAAGLVIVSLLVGSAAAGVTVMTTDALDIREPEPETELQIHGPTVAANISDCANDTCDVTLTATEWQAVSTIEVTHYGTNETYYLSQESPTLTLSNVSLFVNGDGNEIVLSLPIQTHHGPADEEYIYVAGGEGTQTASFFYWDASDSNEFILNGSDTSITEESE